MWQSAWPLVQVQTGIRMDAQGFIVCMRKVREHELEAPETVSGCLDGACSHHQVTPRWFQGVGNSLGNCVSVGFDPFLCSWCGRSWSVMTMTTLAPSTWERRGQRSPRKSTTMSHRYQTCVHLRNAKVVPILKELGYAWSLPVAGLGHCSTSTIAYHFGNTRDWIQAIVWSVDI